MKNKRMKERYCFRNSLCIEMKLFQKFEKATFSFEPSFLKRDLVRRNCFFGVNTIFDVSCQISYRFIK